MRITGESTAKDGALQIDADVLISTKKDPQNKSSRGFYMVGRCRLNRVETSVESAHGINA